MKDLIWKVPCPRWPSPSPPRPPRPRRPPTGRPLPTSTCGSSSRSSWTSPTSTPDVYTGSTGKRASSRSSTPSGWLTCGASARTDLPWTTTSFPDHSGSITRRASWRRRNGRRDWSTSSVHRTTSKKYSRKRIYKFHVYRFILNPCKPMSDKFVCNEVIHYKL